MTDVLDANLVDVALMIRRRNVSSVEVTTGLLERIKRWQPLINAFVEVDEEGALFAARAADESLARGDPTGSLHGVPLAHKDLFDRSGAIVTCGSVLRRDYRPIADATVIQRLKAAGCVTLGSLNMAEFAYCPTGTNQFSGIARNPWNPAYICGGSSSGSGAAVAARLCFGSLGTDTGGSIRLPAAICGTVGLKPTQGCVSTRGAMPLSFSLDCIGPLARTVRDAARLLSVIAQCASEATGFSPTVDDYEAACERGAGGLRIGIPREYFWHGLSSEAAKVLENMIRRTEARGVRVSTIDLVEIDSVVAAANIIIGAESVALHRRQLASFPDLYSSPVRRRIENGLSYTAFEYIDALKYRATALARFMNAAADVDVLAVPSLGISTPTVEEAQDPASSLVAQLTYWTRPVNFLGVPAISIPCGFSSEGLPLAIQLIGKPFRESRLLQAAAVFESVADVRDQRPVACLTSRTEH